MNRKQKELLKKAAVPVFVLLLLACGVRLHSALVTQNIFMSYGIQPLRAAVSNEDPDLV